VGGRDNRDDRMQDDVRENNLEVPDQAPVKSQTFIARLGYQDACFIPIHRRVSLVATITSHCRIIGMNEVT
jgi:hypothetical protein